jgi:hypothetical protein
MLGDVLSCSWTGLVHAGFTVIMHIFERVLALINATEVRPMHGLETVLTVPKYNGVNNNLTPRQATPSLQSMGAVSVSKTFLWAALLIICRYF